MVTNLAPLLLTAPSPGPLRFVKRYAGEKFDAEQFGDRGGAGRTPGVFVAFAGERPIKTTISRRRDKVELTALAICVNDSRRSRDDRKALFTIVRSVEKQLGDTKLGGLAIKPLRYGGIQTLAENDIVYAWGVRFLTQYWIDYTVDPGSAVMQEADGQLVYPPGALLVGPSAPAPAVAVVGTPGAARYAYDLQVLYGTAPQSDWSPWTAIATAPSPLSSVNKLTITWGAVAGATGYRLRRRWTPAGGPTAGVIFTGSALTFTDDGSVAGDGNVLPERGLTYDGDF